MGEFVETLRSWQNFYFMTGGAAATLIGLMFVALSLGMQFISSEARENIRENVESFVTPSIVYFVSTLLLSCVMLAPVYTPASLALVLFLGGAFGMRMTGYHVRNLVRMAQQAGDFNHSDWLAQIVLPVVNYGLILGAAIGFAVNQWALGFTGLWLATILLLLSAIANTWNLVIWIVAGRQD